VLDAEQIVAVGETLRDREADFGLSYKADNIPG
jgi:hypothetical protein